MAQAKTTSLVKNDMVTISAADYCEAVNDAFDTIGVTGYKATLTKGGDGKNDYYSSDGGNSWSEI